MRTAIVVARDWVAAFAVVFLLLFALAVVQGIADPEPARDTVEVRR
jgi:hypothetical protein